jgi:hypothetical protein
VVPAFGAASPGTAPFFLNIEHPTLNIEWGMSLCGGDGKRVTMQLRSGFDTGGPKRSDVRLSGAGSVFASSLAQCGLTKKVNYFAFGSGLVLLCYFKLKMWRAKEYKYEIAFFGSGTECNRVIASGSGKRHQNYG